MDYVRAENIVACATFVAMSGSCIKFVEKEINKKTVDGIPT